MRKRFKIIPDAISKKASKFRNRFSPTGRTSNTKGHLFMEDVLADIGECCGVNYCKGVISHASPVGVVSWGIENGAFKRIGNPVTSKKSPKWKINQHAIYRKSHDTPTGRASLPFVEDVLNELSSCCGTNCFCGGIRLPNWDEGVIYEWSVDDQGNTVGPTKVGDLVSNKRLKKKWHIDPNSIYTRRRKRVNRAGVRGRIEYFEDMLQKITDSGFIGFDCCAGRLLLADTAVDGDYYEVKVEKGAFVVSKLDSCGNTTAPTPPPPQPTPPTATVNQAGGQADAPMEIAFANNFPAGTTVTLQVDFNGAGATPVTYTVPAGGETAAQVATGIEALPVWNTNNVTPSAAAGVITVTPATGDTVELTGGSVGGTTITIPPPPPIATVTKTGGQPGDEAEIRFENDFPAGTVVTLQMKFQGGAATPVTYTVPAGGQTAGQVAVDIAKLPDWRTNGMLAVGAPTSATQGGLSLTPDTPANGTVEITGGTIGGTPFSVPAPPPTAGGTVVVTGSPTATSGDTIQITFSGVFQAGQTVNVAIDFTGDGSVKRQSWTATGGETADQAAAAVAALAWRNYASAISVTNNIITVNPFIDPGTATVTVT